MTKQWIKRATPLILTVLAMLLITACGGGGDSTNSTGSGFLPPPGLTNITITGGGGCSVINALTTVPLPSSNVSGAYGLRFAVATDIESERSPSDPDRVEIALTLPSGNAIKRSYNCPVSRACDPDKPSAGFSPNCG